MRRPVIVTNRCAEACARDLSQDVAWARDWLEKLIAERGRVTEQPPLPVRSPSGRFLVVDGMFVLPLAADRNGTGNWIATNCLLLPEIRQRHGVAGTVDPFRLRGAELLTHVHFSTHAVQRFQERYGGDPNPQTARAQLAAVLAPTVHTQQRAPGWCRSRPQDFYLVAADEFCLPATRNGSGGKAFEAVTCIHRAADLFQLTGTSLESGCRVDPALSERNDEITAAFRHGASLSWSWRRPSWTRDDARARAWIIFSNRLAAPVAVQYDNARQPLLILDLHHRRSLLARLLRRWSS